MMGTETSQENALSFSAIKNVFVEGQNKNTQKQKKYKNYNPPKSLKQC